MFSLHERSITQEQNERLRSAKPIIDEARLMPRHCVGYCAIWDYDEPVCGERWRHSPAGLNLPQGPVAFLDRHVWHKRFGLGTLDADSVGLFFDGRFDRSWFSMKRYKALLAGDDYFGFSTANKSKSEWSRHGDGYLVTDTDMDILEVSLHPRPVFRKTYAVLCHATEVAKVRRILRMRLEHDLPHVKRSAWKNLADLESRTQNDAMLVLRKNQEIRETACLLLSV